MILFFLSKFANKCSERTFFLFNFYFYSLMKKLTYLLVLAALALPMSAHNHFTTKAEAKKAMAEQVVRHTDNPVVHPRVTHVATRPALNLAPGMVMVSLSVPNDIWDDGSGYQMLLDADHDAYGTLFFETGPLAYGSVDDAVYAQFEYKIPENADGSIYTTNIVVEDWQTITIPAGTYDYVITNPTPYDYMWIASNFGDQPGRYDNFEFEPGMEYIFTVEMTDWGYDGVYLETIGEPVYPTIPEVPVGLTVDPGVRDAEVYWEREALESGNLPMVIWNLRYRPYDSSPAPEYPYYLWDFEEAQNSDNSLQNGWTSIDADGDGYTWYHLNTAGGVYNCHSGYGHLTSASYFGAALSPDNWLVSPEVVLNGQLSFWANGQDPSYAKEHFAAYVTVGDPNDLSGYVALSDVIEATGTCTEYTFDLSEYEGQTGHIAIRHFDCYDMFRLNIDDVAIGNPANRAAEWTNMDHVDAPFTTLTGLEPETTYEVQVQAVDAYNYDLVSDWCESVVFTTLPEQAPQGQTAAPEIVTTPDDEVFTFTGQVKEGDPEAEVSIYVINEDGERVLVTNPFVVTRTEEDQIIQLVAVAHIDGQIDGETIITVLVPARKITGIDELMSGKSIATVRYFNMAGQEMQQPSGMTIVVTTYTDGTTTAAKVMK